MEERREMTYLRLLDEVAVLYKEERYQEAVRLLNLHGHKVGGNVAQIYDRLCSLTSRMGQFNLALAIMQEAVDKGLWLSPDRLRSDPDLEPLHRFDAFEDVLNTCAQREEEARQSAAPRLRMLSEGSNDFLLLVLHGELGSNDISEMYWRFAADMGGVAALAQSSVESFSDAFIWDDVEKGAAELEGHLRPLQERFSVPPERTVLAGFSSGCDVIMRAILEGRVKASTLLLISPRLPVLDGTAFRPETLKGVRVRIVVGERDEECLERLARLGSLLDDAGVDNEIRVVEGMGHGCPDDLPDDLAAALEEV
ncbi:MAG: alpha/beta hydrolase [Methanomassiliicoccaceae archaeon]|jgi:predicted esterase|nr:hypothetical protein [Euryarchaeota archaeon]HOB37936.1 hypothetical protein [Methanomassiliicoccaceae archaeon]HQA21112.1 hypothetical protein [Methanomassiliicoccaceae archaeon]HQD87648.1 hypothetical protein [Methanomassiliicoccaceae archaeon]